MEAVVALGLQLLLGCRNLCAKRVLVCQPEIPINKCPTCSPAFWCCHQAEFLEHEAEACYCRNRKYNVIARGVSRCDFENNGMGVNMTYSSCMQVLGACLLVACWAGEGLGRGQHARAFKGLPEHIVPMHTWLNVSHVGSVSVVCLSWRLSGLYAMLHCTML